MWTIIAWIVVGGVAGWIASKIMGTDASMGIPANVITGVVGAGLFGFLWNILFADGNFMDDPFSIPSFLASIVGACLLLFIVGKLTHRR
ncbi:GlsB/YeaQ/YmgE family stress response membrane protein [Kytococcus schroeteri]|uniref:GlsB/YeaQ/YmgE family stress response membrane protein n=1 Tax=Kytococcus schroeteri TaxID=138300 RepID=UPI0035E91B69